MIKLFINGLAASAGGGLTYLRNVIPHLSLRADVQTTVILNSAIRGEFDHLARVAPVQSTESSDTSPPLRRFVNEQKTLPELIRRSAAQVLLSPGNFALWNSPVPQILLSRNSLYLSADFKRDLRARHEYALWADTLIKGWLARQSIRRATVTVAPSEVFAADLARWSGRKVVALHHGFDADTFCSEAAPLPQEVEAQINQASDALRLLFVSHYNYYRNFETLFRSLPILSERLGGKKVKLFLTCRLNSYENPGSYRAEAASSIVNRLRASANIVELGAVPYRSLHHLYRACHIYVTPAYAETFAHPLVESMSSGLPIVASDLPVHREICGDASLYFPRFSPQELAERVLKIHDSPKLAGVLSENGQRRARAFSWRNHVDRLMGLAQELIQSERGLRNV